jgi:Family of unknown function (DUF6427)
VISIFRKNLFINSIILLPYIGLLRLKSFFLDQPYIPGDGESYLTKSVFGLFDSVPLQGGLAILIIYINALMINRIVIKNNITKDNNLVSGLMYVLFASFMLDLLPLSPVLLASPFIILSVQCVFNSYNNLKASDEIFLSGLYMSIAFMFYFPIVYFFLFTMIGFIIMRSFTFKERMQHIVGWIVPMGLAYGWQYFKMYPTRDVPHYFYSKMGFIFFSGIPLSSLLLLVFLTLVILICIFSFGTYMSKKVIASQKRISLLYFLMLFAGLTVFIYGGLRMDHIHIIAIPFSIFITLNLLEMKNQLWPEIIHLLFILLLVILHLDLIKI